MKTIIFFAALTVVLLYTLGLGLTLLLIPRSLREYTLWLSPWYLIVTLIFVLVILSLFGLSVDQVYLPILAILLGTNYYVFVVRHDRVPVDVWQDLGTMFLVGISILVSISPLLLKTKFLTTISLGNNDIIAYATTADFLRHYSIVTSFTEDTALAVANLVRDGFRWGTPIIQSFFLSIYRLQGYQLSYLLQTIFFAIMAPVVGVLASFLTKRSWRTMWFATIFTIFNVNMLYMLYHNFFGQVIYWGIALLLTLLFFVYFTSHEMESGKLNLSEIIIGLTIVVLFFTYHEPMVFIISPLILYVLIIQIKNWRQLEAHTLALLRIAGVSLLIGSYSIVNALIFDFTQAFRGNPNQPIGWQLFRSRTPYASPFEAMGMWSIHNFPPLPLLISIGLSLLVGGVLIIGLWRMRYRSIFLCHALIYAFFYYWTGIYQHNFFFYNRALTYTLPYLLVMFVSGWEAIYQRSKWVGIVGVFATTLMILWSGIHLNRRFIKENNAVDLTYPIIANIQSLGIVEPIYYVGEITPTPIWQRIWAEYFLYPMIKDSTYPRLQLIDPTMLIVPDQAYVLTPKNSPWIPAPKLILDTPIWQSDYWQVARLCNSESCLMKSSESLDQITFGKNNFEDSLLLSGWSTQEPDSRWANQLISSLRLLTKQTGYKKIAIEAQSLANPQQMRVEIDGKLSDPQTLTTNWQTYIYSFDNGLSSGIHVIKLHYTNLYTPAEILGNGDNRTLTVRLKSIKFVR